MSIPVGGPTVPGPARTGFGPPREAVGREPVGRESTLVGPGARPLDRAEAAADAAAFDPLRGRPPKEADPRLWALLSRAERDFYFRNATFGALTYAPGAGADASTGPARRLGARIDLTA